MLNIQDSRLQKNRNYVLGKKNTTKISFKLFVSIQKKENKTKIFVYDSNFNCILYDDNNLNYTFFVSGSYIISISYQIIMINWIFWFI